MENKLIGMTDYILNKNNIGMEVQSISHQHSDRTRRFYDIVKYAEFLKQPLTLSMFVPVGENGEVLEGNPLSPATDEQWDKWESTRDQYKQALDKVLFKGFEVNNLFNGNKSISLFLGFEEKPVYLHIFWFDSVTQKWHLCKGLKTIENLCNLDIELESKN
jgi:hypothetical protein